MFKRLRQYNGNDTIVLQSVTPDYVRGFADYMTRDGVAPASVRQMLKFFRASFKDVYGPDRSEQFRSAFSHVTSANETETRLTTYDDIKAVADAALTESSALRKIRDIFMFCLYNGGLTLGQLKDNPDIFAAAGRGPTHLHGASERFQTEYGCGIDRAVTALSDEEYRKGLSAIAYILRLPRELTPTSSVHGWIATARHLGISPELIAGAAANPTSFTDNIITGQSLTDGEICRIRTEVANHIIDLTPRWYVMKCISAAPADIADSIKADRSLWSDGYFDTFTVPAPHAPSKRETRMPLVDKLLFFRCTAHSATAIRKHTASDAYIYTLAGTKTPAAISNVEMRTFMLLCDVASDTVAYHFPERETPLPDINVGSTATIMVGNLTGHVGIISKISKDRYKVVIQFHSLGAALISAEVPVEFLKFD